MAFQGYLNPISGSELLMKSCTLNILYLLYQDSCNPVNTMQLSPYGKAIRKTMDFINENMNQKLSLKQLSDLDQFVDEPRRRVLDRLNSCFNQGQFLAVRDRAVALDQYAQQ
jgi:hypothetical protein